MRLMGNLLKLNSLLLLALLFLVPMNAHATLPDRVFAPYVDVTLYPTPSISEVADETGQKYFTLAFVVSSGMCTPSWGGYSSYDTEYYRSEIEAIRAAGGDVIVSFGGASGTELALSCSDEESLLEAYQSVIDAYDLKWVDFDIEGSAVADTVSVDRRNNVIAQLQENNPDLKVAYCLPVLPTGLTSDGLNVIQSAIDAGVAIDVVNVMAMDYGDSAAPNPDGQMGEYAIQSVENTHEQLVALGLTDVQMGVTPMIGYNDVSTEIFYLSDADTVLSWAQQSDDIDMGLLSMWSLNRDNGDCTGYVSAICSGLDIDDYAFTETFRNFTTGSSDGNLWPTVSVTSPEEASSFDLDETITISASASDSDGSVAQVEFLIDSGSIGSVYEFPYTTTWSTSTSGTYYIQAVATDDQGAQTTSSIIAVTVGDDVCSADAWDSETIYTAGDLVSYDGHEWEAKWWTKGDEPDGDAQWGVWNDQGICSTGDDGGNNDDGSDDDSDDDDSGDDSGDDDNNNNTGSCGGLQDYPVGLGSYAAGDQVQNNGSIYEVREWPYSGWANVDAPAYYEPGVGSNWEDAWNYVGLCE